MTVQPFVSLRVDYADTSYFATDIHRDHGVQAVPFEDAQKTLADYATLVLSKWEKAVTKSRPVSYKVYLAFTANYDDGRNAQRASTWDTFESVETALKHVSDRSAAVLKELRGIGADDV